MASMYSRQIRLDTASGYSTDLNWSSAFLLVWKMMDPIVAPPPTHLG